MKNPGVWLLLICGLGMASLAGLAPFGPPPVWLVRLLVCGAILSANLAILWAVCRR